MPPARRSPSQLPSTGGIRSVEVVRELLEAVRARDGYGVAELCADDAEFALLGVTLSGALVIRDCFLDLLGCRLPGWRLGEPVVTGPGDLRFGADLVGPRRELPVTVECTVREERVQRLVVVATSSATGRPRTSSKSDRLRPRGGVAVAQ